MSKLYQTMLEAYNQVTLEKEGIVKVGEKDDWQGAADSDSKNLTDVMEFMDLSEDDETLVEGLTSREKTFLFGGIHRMFGECAKRCGRITILSKANACKDVCNAKKDQAIKAARRRTKADIARGKGKEKKAQKWEKKAKEIESY